VSAGTIRVGFVGAGRNTRRRHIPGFQKQAGVELVAVANRSRESGERVAKEFGIARVYDDWRQLVQAPDVDAVCIGTWPYTHCEMTVAALAAGKHVLCEARMAMDAAEGRRMLDASRHAPGQVAQLVPSPPTLEVDRTLARLIAEGYAGEVLAVDLSATQNARFVDREEPLHWRQDAVLSGHNILNMGIWYEAMLRWLGPARRVMAMTKIAVPQRRDERGTLREVTVPDHVEILATLRDGAVARLRFSGIAALGPAGEVWIFGSDGTLRLDGDGKRLSGARRGDRELREIPIPAAQRVGWRVEEEFVNAIRGREKVARTTFEDGVRYMEFTDAVTLSAAAGRAVEVAAL
jgi:predicted dehydrogenase